MTWALGAVTEELLESSWDPCYRCENEERCERDTKHAHFKSFCELLSMTQLRRESQVDFKINLRNVIIQAMRVSFKPEQTGVLVDTEIVGVY